ncbi:MAG: FAD:protein FMN transferase [Acidimicrobiales bacterium]
MPGSDEVVVRFRAMATLVTIRARQDGVGRVPEDLEVSMRDAREVFVSVEKACTRFDPQSPLMRANARPADPSPVPEVCFAALGEALLAHRMTDGRFDPRVLGDLVALGYDRSLPFAAGTVEVAAATVAQREPLPPWEPTLDDVTRQVVLGPLPVDLGGIGKGLAVRWASAALGRRAPDHLVDAGGDCYCAGSAPGGGPWLVAVEDPLGSREPRAVLSLRDRACATSSIRLRRWTAGGRPVHHLVDPASGRPGGSGLRAVTVVGGDPAAAEVWAKVLFLAGLDGVADLAERRGLAALWVDDAGGVGATAAIGPFVCWGPR